MSEIPENLQDGVKYLNHGFLDFTSYLDETQQSYNEGHDTIIEHYLLFEAFLKSKNYDYTPLKLSTSKDTNVNHICDFFSFISIEFEKRETLNKIESSQNKFGMHFETEFCYEFTTGDLDRIQTLINELRENIIKSKFFEDDHRARLLKRLEKLQAALHKKVTNLDMFWGLVGDAGVALGKFGTDAKPIIDMIKEIANIAWRTQSISEELPSGTGTPFLQE